MEDYAIKIKKSLEWDFSFFSTVLSKLPSWKFWRENNFNVLIKYTLTLSIFVAQRDIIIYFELGDLAACVVLLSFVLIFRFNQTTSGLQKPFLEKVSK